MGWLFRRCDEPGPNEEVRVRAQSLFGQSVVVRGNLAREGDRRASRGEGGGRWWSVWRDEDAVGDVCGKMHGWATRASAAAASIDMLRGVSSEQMSRWRRTYCQPAQSGPHGSC